MGETRMTAVLVFVVVAIIWFSAASAFPADPASPNSSGPCAYYCQFGFMPGVCNCDAKFGLSVAKETPCTLTPCAIKEKCVMVRDRPTCVVAEPKSPVTEPSVSGPILKICKQPKVTGSCYDTIKRFYFNTKKGICEMFVFSGCHGNLNNFQTLSVCQAACGGKKLDENFITVFTAPGF